MNAIAIKWKGPLDFALLFAKKEMARTGLICARANPGQVIQGTNEDVFVDLT
jgi:hypothetical protein